MLKTLLTTVLLFISTNATAISLEAAKAQVELMGSTQGKAVEYKNFYEYSFNGSDYDLKLKEQLVASTKLYNWSPQEREENNQIIVNAIILKEQLIQLVEGKISKLPETNNHTDNAIVLGLAGVELTTDEIVNGINPNTEDAILLIGKLEAQAHDYLMLNIYQMKYFRTIITHNNNGNRILYMTWDGSNCVQQKDPYLKVLSINGQDVKFVAFCEDGEGSDLNYFKATPFTDDGKEYVINEFRKSNWVHVNDRDDLGFPEIKFWANGFTKAWNSAKSL